MLPDHLRQVVNRIVRKDRRGPERIGIEALSQVAGVDSESDSDGDRCRSVKKGTLTCDRSHRRRTTED